MPTIEVINHTAHMKRRTEKIQYIILHYSASTRSNKGSADGTVKTLDSRGYSSDYAVDDNTIIQFADDPANWQSTACQAWSSKNGTEAGRYAKNANSISIEMSSLLGAGGKWDPNDPKFGFSDAVLENTAYLCKMLIAKYNIQKDHIIRHYDIMGKRCPGIRGWNLGPGSASEEEFKKFVDSLYSGSPYVPSEIEYEQTDYTYTPTVANVASNTGVTPNISGASNIVSRLESATRQNENILKQVNRKNEFETLVNKMTNEAPKMGREIIITSELYDSNILKGNQEARKDILNDDKK